MENQIIVSFCIPTYNNLNSARRLVTSILECDSREIEVVVLDNGSTDRTLDELNQIKDQRLNVYSNGINKGALFNMVNVLEKGKGLYLVYCTDHDFVDNSKIDAFLEVLKSNPSVSVGYCEYHSQSDVSYQIYKSGMEALRKMAYVTRHPSGFILKREYWQTNNCVDRFSDFNYVDLFPLEFAFAELSILGDGIVYHPALVTPERGIRVKKHKSSTTDGKSKTAFFAPQTRLKLATNFEAHLHTLNIPESDRKKIAIQSFFRELHAATFTYRNIMMNDAICEHYYMDKREISKLELLKIGLRFYSGYNNEVLKKRYPSFVGQINFKLAIGAAILNKLLAKVKERFTN